jgi:hypothetical protein
MYILIVKLDPNEQDVCILYIICIIKKECISLRVSYSYYLD